MGFSSIDDFISELTANGKYWRYDWNKITGTVGAYTAGRWYDLSLLQGTPPANYPGELVYNNNFQGSIDGWTANGTNWVYGTNSANKTSGTSTTLTATMKQAVIGGRYYRVTYTIAGYSSGTCTVSIGGQAGTGRTANGTYVEVITASNTNAMVFTMSASTAVMNISAVSVVEWGTNSGTLTPMAQIISDTVAQGPMWHGGNVSSDTKHLLNASAVTAVATGIPAQLMLIDQLLVYPYMDANSASLQTFYNTNTLPRYTDGAGVRAYVVAMTTIGATAHNIAMTYTNSANAGTRVMPVTVACTASAIAGHITHAGVNANNYGPFLPMAAGDSGIRSIQNMQLSAASATANTFFHVVLCRPLMTLPLIAASVAAERDFINQIPSLPRIYDGANLQWLYFAGAATANSTNFYGSLDFGWG